MSAYVCDQDHIGYLVEAGTSRVLNPHHGHLTWVWDVDRATNSYERAELQCLDREQMSRVGQMLWDENVASVRYRYDTPDGNDLPGPIDCDFQYGQHQFRLNVRIDPVQVIKSCDCFGYQSCEHPGWKDSEAFAFIEALRAAAWHVLPGYDSAVWGAPPLPERSNAVLLSEL